MKTLLLDEIRERMGAKRHAEMVPAAVTGVCTDSRLIKAGDLFFAIPGDKFDGHAFLAEVLAKGAVGVVVAKNKPLPAGVDVKKVLVVDDTIAALGKLAAAYRDMFSGTVIAVTGSNGKTTTKEMIAHILGRRYRVHRSVKSFNNHIGVPLTILSCESDIDFLIAEVGTNHPGEIDQLAGIVRPDVAVITNAGESHLEGFGSVDRVAAEKASLVKHVRAGGAAIVNGERELLLRLVKQTGVHTISFGTSAHCDMRITSQTVSENGLAFEVNGKFHFDLPVPGMHNAMNALAAIVVARRAGLEMSEIAESLKDFKLPGMRLEILKIGDYTVLNDAYNANPASMGAAMSVLSGMQTAGRKVFCCGQMLELGERSETYHRELARKIGQDGVDVLVTVGKYAKEMADEAVAAGLPEKNVHSYATSEEAGQAIGGMIHQGDLILVKGSRGIQMEKVIEKIKAKVGS
jgi:UDP-N-acetylmuramoyl-tripeptide--D-alanyl-D-alanine ligase